MIAIFTFTDANERSSSLTITFVDSPRANSSSNLSWRAVDGELAPQGNRTRHERHVVG